MTAILYLIFFLSGAAALVYEVVWLRALILVFGGSHLAVTAVLSVFMGGLALGGWGDAGHRVAFLLQGRHVTDDEDVLPPRHRQCRLHLHPACTIERNPQ